ncbi:MAG: universal stress protein [Deltaproteobacteria bacterium]|nr:universal stress protein [Deltaproteobacteria bacterium]
MAFSLRSVLAPVDFGAGSDHSLQVALDLAKLTGAHVHVLHVYQIPVYGFPDGAFLAGPEIATRLSEAAQKGLDNVVARVAATGAQVTGHLRQGNPPEEIVAAAEELGVDTIVLGTHGRKGIAHAIMGSVAERVVRTSPIPVLTARTPHE